MKLQHLIIIFLAIMLPLMLILSQYIGMQTESLAMKTKYDTALLDATYDTMSAFQINTVNDDKSSVVQEEIRNLEAVISVFTKSLATSLGLNGVSNDYILSYVPAMVFGLYDGYYIYTPTDNGGEHQLKPYVYYTRTYKNPSTNTDITISYSLDNYVCIYGKYSGNYISASGYLVVPDDVVTNDIICVNTVDDDGESVTKIISGTVTYKGIAITEESIYENETVKETEGLIINKEETNTDAMVYYYKAKEFTQLYNDVIGRLKLEDKNKLEISATNDPDNPYSAFVNEKESVIKDSITSNLNTALYHFEGVALSSYEMPQLSGNDWEKILSNISIIAFLKDVPLGLTSYNNYVVVNNSANQNYTNINSIDFIEYTRDASSGRMVTNGYYHKISCDDLITDTYDELVGYASVDFERYKYAPDDVSTDSEYYYYYKHNEYADYDCEVTREEGLNLTTIEPYLASQTMDAGRKNTILKSYYTAVGRIRYRTIKASDIIGYIDPSHSFRVTYNANNAGRAFTWSKSATGTFVQDSVSGEITILSRSESPYISGKQFQGWSLDPYATEAEIKPSDSINVQGTAGITRSIVLYAVYAEAYTVTYDLEGGSGSIGQQTKIENVPLTLSAQVPTKAGYTFLGWTETPSPAETETPQYQPGDIYTDNRNITLHAIWSENVCRITYVIGDGLENQIRTVSMGSQYTIETVSYAGRVLAGYAINSISASNGNVVYRPGDVIQVNTNLTLYAVWQPRNCIVTYDGNGGECGISADTVQAGKTYIVKGRLEAPSEPTREGYTFLGWSENREALTPDDDYTPGGLCIIENDITLYAIWQGEEKIIRYYGNADSVTNLPAEQVGAINESMTISSQLPVREGYTFKGWADPNRLGIVEYEPGDAYTGRTNKDLYAVWEIAQYTITFDANGGTNPPAQMIKTHGYPIIIPNDTPNPPDSLLYFAGWSTDKDATVPEYTKGQQFSLDQDTTLYAIWTTEGGKVTITFEGRSGASNVPLPISVDPGTKITIPEQIPERGDGYTFLGWSTNAMATVAEAAFNPGSEYTVNNNMTLYAVWQTGQITLTVNPNGGVLNGSTTTQNLTVAADGIIQVLPTRSGYKLSGWTITRGSVIFNSEYPSILTMQGQSSTIVAQWKAQTYTLSYNPNGGTGAPASSEQECDAYVTISSQIPTRSGYEFLGWSTTSTGNAMYSAGQSNAFRMPANDVVLYAIWSKTYTVTYDANTTSAVTGMPSPTSYTYKSGDTHTVYTGKPQRSAYTFLGWSTSSSATTAQYTGGETITVNTNITLYAIWKADRKVILAQSSGNYWFLRGTGTYSGGGNGYSDTVTVYTSSGSVLSQGKQVINCDGFTYMKVRFTGDVEEGGPTTSPWNNVAIGLGTSGASALTAGYDWAVSRYGPGQIGSGKYYDYYNSSTNSYDQNYSEGLVYINISSLSGDYYLAIKAHGDCFGGPWGEVRITEIVLCNEIE